MSDLFQAYHTTSMNPSHILEDYYKKYGTPPQILYVNKSDSESFKGENVEVHVKQWVLPNNFFLEIVDPLEVNDGQI